MIFFLCLYILPFSCQHCHDDTYHQQCQCSVGDAFRHVQAGGVKAHFDGVLSGRNIHCAQDIVGYRAAKQGSKLTLTLGFSHPVEFEDTDTIKIELKDALHFSITGIDKQEVGQFAAEVRGVRPPEPYKGKGIRYVGEYVIRKEGKAGKGK